jgi:hypothetical protein
MAWYADPDHAHVARWADDEGWWSWVYDADQIVWQDPLRGMAAWDEVYWDFDFDLYTPARVVMHNKAAKLWLKTQHATDCVHSVELTEVLPYADASAIQAWIDSTDCEQVDLPEPPHIPESIAVTLPFLRPEELPRGPGGGVGTADPWIGGDITGWKTVLSRYGHLGIGGQAVSAGNHAVRKVFGVLGGPHHGDTQVPPQVTATGIPGSDMGPMRRRPRIRVHHASRKVQYHHRGQWKDVQRHLSP